jgi:hypothetical protein
MANLLWRLPEHLGFQEGYIVSDQYLRQLDQLINSGDPEKVDAAVEDMIRRMSAE